MGKTRNTHKVRKILRLRINKHLHCEIRTKLRNAKRPKLAPADVLRLDSQRVRTLEQTHDLPGIQRNILNRIQSRKILQHTDHRRIIVSENIKLQQVVVDGVVIEMRRDRLRRHIIRRMLYRGKRIDHLAERQNNDTSRMLSRCTPDADTSLNDPVDLTISLSLSMLLKIIFHISVGRLICQSTDGTRTERLSFTEDNLRVIMGAALVFTGEV